MSCGAFGFRSSEVFRDVSNSGVPLWLRNYGQMTKFFEGKISAPVLLSTGAWTPTASEYVLGNARRIYNVVRSPWYPV